MDQHFCKMKTNFSNFYTYLRLQRALKHILPLEGSLVLMSSLLVSCLESFPQGHGGGGDLAQAFSAIGTH
jgi:hypothetical protein